MKKFILGILVFLSISAHSQITSPPDKKTLIEDETWVVASGKSSFRIITSNDSISSWIIKQFQYQGMDRVTYSKKSDRNGEYWERSFYFRNTMWSRVVTFINNKFK